LGGLLELQKGLDKFFSEIVGEINITEVLFNISWGVVSLEDGLGLNKSLSESLSSVENTSGFLNESIGRSQKIIEIVHSLRDGFDDGSFLSKISLNIEHFLLGITLTQKASKTKGKDGSQQFLSVVDASN
jgi:hypothetical protein